MKVQITENETLIKDENILGCIKVKEEQYTRSINETLDTISKLEDGSHPLSGADWFISKMDKQLSKQKRGLKAIRNLVSNTAKIDWVLGLNKMPDLSGFTKAKCAAEQDKFISHYSNVFGKDKTQAKTDELEAELETLFFIYYCKEPPFKHTDKDEDNDEIKYEAKHEE